MEQQPDTYVRFYFQTGVSWLIPTNPYGKRSGTTDTRWEQLCFQNLESQLGKKLESLGFQCSVRGHSPVDEALRVFRADVVVSALHPFPATKMVRSSKKSPKLRVKKEDFTAVKNGFKATLKKAIEEDFVFTEILFKYATSRFFIFEVYLEADLHIKYVISRDDIRNSEGSIAAAIDAFNDSISGLLSDTDWMVIQNTTGRRPKDSIYKFTMAATKLMSFSEQEVEGDFSLIDEDMDPSEIDCLECSYKTIPERVLEEKATIQECVEHLDVVYLSCFYIDDSEDVFDYGNELG